MTNPSLPAKSVNIISPKLVLQFALMLASRRTSFWMSCRLEAIESPVDALFSVLRISPYTCLGIELICLARTMALYKEALKQAVTGIPKFIILEYPQIWQRYYVSPKPPAFGALRCLFPIQSRQPVPDIVFHTLHIDVPVTFMSS